MSRGSRGAAALVACTLVATASCGCKLRRPPETGQLTEEALPNENEIPDDWAAGVEDDGYVDDGWIASFDDPKLVDLTAEAIENNLNLRLAAAQVERAAGLARIAASSLKPTIGIGADAGGRVSSRQYQGQNVLSGATYGATLNIRWEADVWGKLRARAAAGEAALEATQEDFQYARQSLAAATAKTWFLATAAREQVELTEQAIELFEDILDVVEAKEEVGQVSQQDVYLASADVASAQESRELAQSGYEQTQRALEVLLGRYPSAEIGSAEALAVVPPPIPVGVPSDIIARRPDLIAAERRVAAAFYQREDARLARLPSFTINASGGYTDLTQAIGQLSAGMFAPLYTGGALEGQVDVATADQQAAIAAYGQTLLNAFQEVENALGNEVLFEKREKFLGKAVADNERALKKAKARFDVGRIDLLSVLQIQARVLAARSTLIAVRNERLAQRVNLHLALGGSFEQRETEESEDT